jgi:hypothetical protein
MAPTAPGSRRSTVVPPHLALIVVAVASTALLGWSGLRATRLETARRTDLRRAQNALDDFAALRRRYEPAVAAESIAWRRALLDLRELGVTGDQRLAMTQRVSRAAESTGLREVRVHIRESDTTGAQARPSMEGVQSQLAPYSLLVECKGGLSAVLAFLGQLPPSVAPTTLTLVRQDGRGPHRISLAVYELTFSNGEPPEWTSLERDHDGARDVGRPGS